MFDAIRFTAHTYDSSVMPDAVQYGVMHLTEYPYLPFYTFLICHKQIVEIVAEAAIREAKKDIQAVREKYLNELLVREIKCRSNPLIVFNQGMREKVIVQNR